VPVPTAAGAQTAMPAARQAEAAARRRRRRRRQGRNGRAGGGAREGGVISGEPGDFIVRVYPSHICTLNIRTPLPPPPGLLSQVSNSHLYTLPPFLFSFCSPSHSWWRRVGRGCAHTPERRGGSTRSRRRRARFGGACGVCAARHADESRRAAIDSNQCDANAQSGGQGPAAEVAGGGSVDTVCAV
jgi:hypothetical protein